MKETVINNKQLEILLIIGLIIIGIFGCLMSLGIFGVEIQQAFNSYCQRLFF